MPEILHDLFIRSAPEKVFDAISTPNQIDNWWSLESSGKPMMGEEYRLFFGHPWDWRARVTLCQRHRSFEWEMTRAMDDWMGTRVGFELEAVEGGTKVRFHHRGWADAGEHFRISSYCWGTLLRLLKVYVETGAVLAHAERSLL